MATEKQFHGREFMQEIARNRGIRAIPSERHPLKLHLLTVEGRADSDFYDPTASASGSVIPGIPAYYLNPHRKWLKAFNDKYSRFDLRFDLFHDSFGFGSYLAIIQEFPYEELDSWNERLMLLFNVLHSVLPPTRKNGVEGFGQWISENAWV